MRRTLHRFVLAARISAPPGQIDEHCSSRHSGGAQRRRNVELRGWRQTAQAPFDNRGIPE